MNSAVRPVIFLHVGAMKTGTTFVQSLMYANRQQLLGAGLLVPGNRPEQVRGVSDILHDGVTGAWDLLVGRMFTHEGLASVISMEFLSFAQAAQAAQVVESLRGADVRVILTVRDAARAMPAQWQTYSTAGGSLSWPRFARQVKSEILAGTPVRSRGARTFARTQGIPRMLEAWGATVPAGRLHVITVPPAGSEPMLLWDRFAGVLGVDPAVCSVAAPRSNTSLGYPSTDLLRRLNARLGKLGKPPRGQFAKTLGRHVAPHILAVRAPLERPIQMNVSTLRFALNWNRRVRDAIDASGAQLCGDEEELPIRFPSHDLPPATPLVNPSDDEVVAAACTARDGLLELVAQRAGELSAAGQPLDAALPRSAAEPTTPQRWASGDDPLEAALDELCSLVTVAVELQQRIEELTAAPSPSQG